MKKIPIPEHQKLKKISEQSQACGSFVEWLEERGFRIIHANHRTIRFVLQRELAAFFDINEEKLEKEKLALLDGLRRGNV